MSDDHGLGVNPDDTLADMAARVKRPLYESDPLLSVEVGCLRDSLDDLVAMGHLGPDREAVCGYLLMRGIDDLVRSGVLLSERQINLRNRRIDAQHTIAEVGAFGKLAAAARAVVLAAVPGGDVYAALAAHDLPALYRFVDRIVELETAIPPTPSSSAGKDAAGC